MRERAPEVVSVAAKVKELQAGEYFVCKSGEGVDSRNLAHEFII